MCEEGRSLSLVNFGDFTKPVTVFIEKTCNAVGILYEPKRIIRRAKAEAKADKIKALSSIELTDIEQRGIDRLVIQEGKKQENIESIAFQAAQILEEKLKNSDDGNLNNVEDIEEDWIANLFKHCDTVSDREMQSLWANLLSEEAFQPGSFSKRTITLMASLDTDDASLFTNFCQFCWFSQFSGFNGIVRPLIYDYKDNVYVENGINFSTLLHLDSLGLVSFDHLSVYTQQGLQQTVQLYYFGNKVSVELNEKEDSGFKMNLGSVILTQAGIQLALICGAKSNQKFYDFVISDWEGKGYKVTQSV